ncbi:cytochrome P450 [Aspergillus bertholletiae]|uniref:Cytochrome P450 n=1 Tax=Aspergillus bertholletiae TaxID=1226010 RepID=A0A5N7B961_9EURO|nr:cytochrome P450 [Aspergillus bertholletiae]
MPGSLKLDFEQPQLWDTLHEHRVALSITFVVLFILHKLLFVFDQDAREPTLIKPRIPLIGHAINIYRFGSRHFVGIAKKCGLPIYQIPVPGGRIAIVNTPEVLSHVDKNPDAIAFAPIAALVINKLSGLSKQGSKTVLDKTMGPNKLEGYMNAVMVDIHSTLAPGPRLEPITTQVAYDLNGSIKKLHGKTTRMNLLYWFRHEFGMSSTNGIYGPENPFKDPKVEAGFWAFDDNISDLLITPKASLTCPTGDRGRADAWAGFAKYFENDGHLKGSELVKVRHRHAAERGLSSLDIGKLEVTMIIGILTNTVPTIFWAVYYVYRDADLLAALRDEISQIATPKTVEGGSSRTWTIKNIDLKTKAPLLTATINETFRHRTCGISSRFVTQDVTLKNEYLIKKGTVMELPNNVLHSNPNYWGSTVGDFNPRRFLADSRSAEAKAARGAFRPFGGGASLCAGRHQAMSQMLGGLALFIMSSDCVPAENGGEWKFPGAHGHTIAAAVDLPSSDLWLDVSPRKGYEADLWVLDPEAKE